MSQVSNALFRLGDQFRQGFNEQGQNYLDVANLGLKEAQIKRQSAMDALAMPGLKLNQSIAQRGLDQAAKLEEAFNPGQLMGNMGSFEMAVSADKDGTPGLERMARFAFDASYDPEKNVFVRKDGRIVTNKEAMEATPRVQQWYAMNFSPYRGARSNRDEMVLTLSSIGDDHPDAKGLQDKISQYNTLMKNPEWKLQSLEKIKAYVSQLPDDPYGEKKNNLDRIEKEIGIVKGEYNAMVKRAQGLSDKAAERTHQKELKGLEITAADKRAGLSRQTTLDAARIRAGASGNKFNKGEAEYEDALVKNKILGAFGLQVDMNGNPTGQVTKAQLDQMNRLAAQNGYEVYSAPGEIVDKPGIFTGDEQMHQIIGIGRITMPGRGGAREALGGPRPAAQTTPQPDNRTPLSGPAAVKESKRLIQMIDAGTVNEKQLLDSLLASGQNEVVRNIVSELKKKRLSNDQKVKPAGPQKTTQQLRDEEEQRRRDEITKQNEALKKPTDWNAVYRFTNRNAR